MQMILSENFIVDQLKSTDADILHLFLLDNTERLSRFFPLTLSSNITIEKSVDYIEAKNDEIQRKINFTFAIRGRYAGYCGFNYH
jgi:ribosomal-protein-alanine N-acetyltransferase